MGEPVSGACPLQLSSPVLAIQPCRTLRETTYGTMRIFILLLGVALVVGHYLPSDFETGRLAAPKAASEELSRSYRSADDDDENQETHSLPPVAPVKEGKKKKTVKEAKKTKAEKLAEKAKKKRRQEVQNGIAYVEKEA